MQFSGNRRVLASAALVSAMCGLSASASGSVGISVTVVPSSAPNAFGSSSWLAYAAGALNSLHNGLGSTGNRATDPTAYEVAGPIIPWSDATVSGFNSWMGTANPGTPFGGEYGNRLHFGVVLDGHGQQQFQLDKLTFNMTSTDSSNSLNFAGDFVGLGYGVNRFGVDYGPDRLLGGGDDITYTTGNGLTMVDRIVYVGVGNAFDATFEPGGTNQDKLYSVRDYIGSEVPFDVSCSYTMHDSISGGVLGSDDASVRIIPSPGTVLTTLLGIGLTPLRRVRRRR